MGTNEILEKAKELKSNGNYAEVITLLENHVKDNKHDMEALAIYFVCKAMHFFVEHHIGADQLYGDSASRYQGLSVEFAREISSFKFMHGVSSDYLEGKDTTEKLNSAYIILQDELSALGETIYPYEIFKSFMDSFYDTMISFDIRDSVYYILTQFIDWESQLSKNMLQFIVEKAEAVVAPLKMPEEEIYRIYTESVQGSIIPKFNARPQLEGGYPSISSEEEKDFWVGYFELLASVREKELSIYNGIVADKANEQCLVLSAWKFVYHRLDGYRNLLASDEYWSVFKVVKSIRITEEVYTKEIQEANKLAKTISVSLMAKIANFIEKVINKIKGIGSKKN